jgi:acyl-[acyl carrier protein]--UDP-N-acetylglucosamine O-acyltransferase
LPGSIVNAGARLGRNVIINSGAVVEHDCVIGDHVHVASGAVLASAVNVGAGAHIGAGAVVRQCIEIGASVMVGNSSSGIVETASFELPVVNIGRRQHGRIRGANVIDVDGGREDVAHAIERATSPAFRQSLRGVKNPYGDGRSAERIVERLRKCEPPNRLICKEFHEVR